MTIREEVVQAALDAVTPWPSEDDRAYMRKALTAAVPLLMADARELADDLAEHGLRFDPNPTVNSADLERSYLDYIRRMDEHARLLGWRIRVRLDRVDDA